MKNLYRRSLVKYKDNTRDHKDRRKKIAYAVFSYFDSPYGGIEYRKSFTAKPGTPEADFWEIAPEIITQD